MVWGVKIEDVQVLLDLHADDMSKAFRIPTSPSGNFPYHSKDGTPLFVLSGSEDGSPDLAQASAQSASASADESVTCEMCAMLVKVGDMRHHVAAHLMFDTTMPKIPFPCGF